MVAESSLAVKNELYRLPSSMSLADPPVVLVLAPVLSCSSAREFLGHVQAQPILRKISACLEFHTCEMPTESVLSFVIHHFVRRA